MVEAELYTQLSSLCEGRVYPLTAPENVQTPYITYQVINNQDKTSYGGDIYENRYLIQIDIFSPSYIEVKTILGAVKDAVYQFKYQPHNFNSRDLFEKDTQFYRQLIEFNLNI